MQVDRLWRHGTIATLDPARAGLGLIANGAIAARAGRIAFVGADSELAADLQGQEEIDLEGRLVTPGLIDCHTHLVFGGDRCDEFERRLAGEDYQTIAGGGGGIQATVRATRAASEDDLVRSARPRLQSLMADGVTTVEIKSGYGLELDTELRMLRAARRLGCELPVSVVTTLLAAHAVPHGTDRHAYLEQVTQQILPRAAAEGLADAVDGFCEDIAFTPAELDGLYRVARSLGLPVKVHADQLSDAGGAELAARWSALSADHLERTTAAGVAALARAGTVAVLLPGAFFSLRERQLPPVAALRAAGVRMAVATDCNPGTSPLLSLRAAMSMAAIQFGLTVQEAIAGTTREAAYALGRQADIGTLSVGKRADLAIWNVASAAELIYWLGGQPLHHRIWGSA